MKKKICIAIAIVFAIIALACVSVIAYVYNKPVTVDSGTSDIYTTSEIQSAIDIVKEEFNEFEGCKLFSLSYAGDEDSLKEFDYNSNYDEAIVINSVFISPMFGGGGWNSHEIYTWHFILMRENNGEWHLITYGYC